MSVADVPEIPVLDFQLYQPDDPEKQETTKQFLKQLYDTMHDIGFFYIQGHGVPLPLIQSALKNTAEFFDLPLNEKAKIAMANSPHYRGFTRLSRLYRLIHVVTFTDIILFSVDGETTDYKQDNR